MRKKNQPAPDERQLAIRRRDREQCQNCHKGIAEAKDLVAHQIIPTKRGGTEKLSNYITLCAECREGVNER